MIGCAPRFVSLPPIRPIPRFARFSNVLFLAGMKGRRQRGICGEFRRLTRGSRIVGRNPEGFVAKGMAADGSERCVGGSATIIGWMGWGVSLGRAFHPGSYGNDEFGDNLLHDFRHSNVFHVATFPSRRVGGRTAGMITYRVPGRVKRTSRKNGECFWR